MSCKNYADWLSWNSGLENKIKNNSDSRYGFSINPWDLYSTGHICRCSTKTLKMQCSALETLQGRMRKKNVFEVHHVSVSQTDVLRIAFLLLIPQDCCITSINKIYSKKPRRKCIIKHGDSKWKLLDQFLLKCDIPLVLLSLHIFPLGIYKPSIVWISVFCLAVMQNFKSFWCEFFLCV